MGWIDRLLKQINESFVRATEIHAFCASEGLQPDEVYNGVALTLAERFDAGVMPYEDADGAINHIYGAMIDYDGEYGTSFAFLEPVYEVYLAFDEGEYPHGDNADPVEKYTRPMIREILA